MEAESNKIAKQQQRENKSPAQIFAGVVKQLINNESFDSVEKLFTSDKNAKRNCGFLKEIHDELMQEICHKHLTERTYKENFALYNCADEILKQLALHAPSDDMLITLLEMVEELKRDYQFTTTLRALQALLLNYGDEKSKSYDWAFNSVLCCVQQLPLPELLTTGYDQKQAHLLEQNNLIEDLLSRFITIGLFCEPIKLDILKTSCEQSFFRFCGLKSRRNLLCCFLVQLLNKPLALLDLTVTDKRRTNGYTLQVTRKITQDISDLIVDPYFFLTVVEYQARWRRRLDTAKGVYELSSKNIFLTSERLPLIGLGIFYYMLFLDKKLKNILEAAPKVYSYTFIVESNLYLVNTLMLAEETALQLRGLQLALQVLELFMIETNIPAMALELDVHKIFCERLCTLAGYATQSELREKSVNLLTKYILLYDDEGRFLIIRKLLKTLTHMGLKSFLIKLYKDIVAMALRENSESENLPLYYCGSHFRDMILNFICNLPKGVETDLINHAQTISAALNVIRFFAMADCNNNTGFWDLIQEVRAKFFEPLRKGLDFSIAHYKLERKQVEENWNEHKVQAEHRQAMELLDVEINNKSSDTATYGCAHATSQILRPNQKFLQTTATTTTIVVTKQNRQQQKHSCKSYTQEQRNYCKATTTNTTSTAPSSSQTIDEFRQAEEQREKDYAEQDAREEAQKADDAESEAKQAKIEAIRTQILEAALAHVTTHGWTRTAIVQGAEEAGYPSVVHGMFPEGGFALVSYFNGKCNELLVQQLQKETQNGEKEIGNPIDFLVRAVQSRLEMILPYKKQWPQALALIALPQNASTALAQVLTLVDDICYYSGDRSVNFDWYTRRIGLATILKMTEIYMLQDTSANHVKTWEFLKSRMDEAVQLQSIFMQTGSITNRFQRSFNSAFITARNILGLDYTRR